MISNYSYLCVPFEVPGSEKTSLCFLKYRRRFTLLLLMLTFDHLLCDNTLKFTFISCYSDILSTNIEMASICFHSSLLLLNSAVFNISLKNVHKKMMGKQYNRRMASWVFVYLYNIFVFEVDKRKVPRAFLLLLFL